MIFYLVHPKAKNHVHALGRRIENLNFGPFAENLKAVERFVDQGGRNFVAVGGDGTVFDLTNGLYRLAEKMSLPLHGFSLGAWACGSSNDFHKNQPRLPAFGQRRDDFTRAEAMDLIRFDFNSTSYVTSLNASVGVTAVANAQFNSDSPSLGFLKRLNMNVAIQWVAIQTVLSYQPLTIDIDGQRSSISNLGIAKSRFFAGEFCYPEMILPSDGQIGLFTIPAKGRLGLIRALLLLGQGRYDGIPGAQRRSVSRLELKADLPFSLEINGEVFKTSHCKISLLPGALKICPLI